MKQEHKKRGRQEEEKELRNLKKQEVITFDNNDCIKKQDSFQALGVFDFPWMKENKTSESDDWKLDDVFSSSLSDTSWASGIDFSKEELCDTPVLVEFPGEKLESDSWRTEDDEKTPGGNDCIWSSVLNQPLFSGTSKISNV